MSDDTTQNGDAKDPVVTRMFDAPVDRVWRAWSEPEAVRERWGPTGLTSPTAEMDFREGGTSLVCVRAPREFDKMAASLANA